MSQNRGLTERDFTKILDWQQIFTYNEKTNTAGDIDLIDYH